MSEDEHIPTPQFSGNEFITTVAEKDTVRLIVDPETPLRGQDSFDGFVVNREETDGGVMFIVESSELLSGDLPDNYENIEVQHRFTIPQDSTVSETPVEVESDWSGRHEAPQWSVSGYLVNAGVLKMFGNSEK